MSTSVAGKIFISYRRTDSSKDARALYERLRREFGEGRVFIDLEGIGPGEDFIEQLEHHLDGCEVLVVLIGPGWAEARSERGERRLHEADDFVRIELRAALARGIKVFPVLIDGALPPRSEQLPEDLQPLVRRQAIVLDYAKFESDLARLVHAIRSESERRGSTVRRPDEHAPPLTGGWRPYAYAFGAVFVMGGAAAFWLLPSPKPGTAPSPAATDGASPASGAHVATPPTPTSAVPRQVANSGPSKAAIGKGSTEVASRPESQFVASQAPAAENLLFYNAQTGAGAIAKLQGDDVSLVKTYPPGAFSSKWTHITATTGRSILFYDSTRQAAGQGQLGSDDFTTTQEWPARSFGQWTNIVPVPRVAAPLFYNAADGSGAIGYAPSLRTYPPDAFARGWTHIAATNSALLFYNASNGAGSIVVPVAAGKPGGPRSSAALDDLQTLAVYKPGSFSSGWTHVVSTASGILFYNKTDGSGGVGRIVMGPASGQASFQTDRSYPVGSFSTGWTQIEAADNKIVFYNSSNGAAGVGEIAGGAFNTTKSYAAHTFAAGWTHLVVSPIQTVKR